MKVNMSVENNNAPTDTSINQSSVADLSGGPGITEGVDNSDGESSGENQVVEAPKAVAAVKARLKKLKLKVDGQEFDEDLPFEIDDEPAQVEYMRKHLQMSKMSDKRAREKNQLEKDVNSFIAELKKNPRKILSDPSIGVDIKQFAAQIIEDEIENARKSPEQLEKEKLVRELEDMKSEREKEKEELKSRELHRLEQQEFDRYNSLMDQAFSKNPDLPKSPYVMKKMTDYMMMGLQEGMDVTPEDLIPLIKEEMKNDVRQMFDHLPEDVIESIVGKDKINQIRKKSIAKHKTAPTAKVIDTGVKKSTVSDKAPATKQTFKDFFGI